MNRSKLSRRSFLQVVGVGAASAAVLTACPTPAPSADSGSGSAPAMETTTVTMGLTWGATFRPRQQEFNDMFMERHPEIALDVTYNTWSDHNNIVPTWAAAEQLPDIVYVHGSRAFPWAFEGISIPLDSYTESDTEFDIAGVWEESLRLYRFQGEQHGIPYDHGPILLGYNKDIFDAADMDYPDETWTMETMREAAAKLTNLEGEIPQWGYTGNNPSLGNSPSCIGSWGGEYLNEDETELLIDSPEAREALQFWTDMIHVDQSAPTPAESEAFEQGPWLGGQVAMENVPSWATPNLTEFAQFGWDVAPWPEGPAGRVTGAFGSGFSITNDSEVPDESWTFMSEYLSVEGMSFVWGESGRGSPARKASYESWMNSVNAPEHAEYYLEALDTYAVTWRPYQTLGAAELNDLESRSRGLLKAGDIDVDGYISALVTDGPAILQEAWDRLQAASG
ncbi:sugar ABC transporter substrate-binding protein [Chloroflexi bacterium TSY]|nr:sugar ABC transporter substrate-binding protein [Chloroflexi bacterium TSY]